MNFDLRLPIGLMFSIYGVLLTVYGFMTGNEKANLERSMMININLVWGLVLLAFGVFMLLLAMRGRKQELEAQAKPEEKAKINR